MKKITLSVAALTIAMMSYSQTQCEGLTKNSVQCKNTNQDTVTLCYLHNTNYVQKTKSTVVVCDGTTKTGNCCKNKTKNDNGFCHNHQPKKD